MGGTYADFIKVGPSRYFELGGDSIPHEQAFTPFATAPLHVIAPAAYKPAFFSTTILKQKHLLLELT